MSLFLYQNNNQTGPFTDEQINQMVLSHQITPNTLAWKEGMKDWAPVSTLVNAPGLATPPPPPPRPAAPKSALGITSFVISLVTGVGWVILLAIAGLAHNAGTPSETFNVIVGLFFMGGVCVNVMATIFGIIALFKNGANTFSIIGVCLNAFQILALIFLIIVGLAAKGH